jgi:hypothetical protein
LIGAMSCHFTRRRDLNHDRDRGLIHFDDVQVGTVGLRAGVPYDAPSWAGPVRLSRGNRLFSCVPASRALAFASKLALM